MVSAAGAGPQPIPHKQLSSEKLAHAIRFCLTEEASAAATAVSRKMKAEFGVQQAVESFHANLPLSALRCHILSEQPAAWSYAKGGKEVHLSKVAAQILIDNGCVTWSSLRRYEPNPIHMEVRRWDPASAVVSSLVGTWTGMATSAADIVVEPIKAFSEKPETGAKEEGERGQSSSTSFKSDKGTSEPAHSTASDSKAGTPENSARNNRFARAALGSASGVGRFFHHFSKGMLLEMPLAATEGLRAVPKLYGGEVQERRPITDWKSGAVVAGTNFQEGIVGGFTDLVRQPIDGGRKEGALGVAKGVGKGLVGMTTKVTSGAFLVAHHRDFSRAS
jgi:hypothetical protein